VLSEAQVDEVVRLYGQGWSLRAVGRHLDDHDCYQAVREGLVDVGGVLGPAGEPVEGGDDAVADLVGG
jgi:hypothetical protein